MADFYGGVRQQTDKADMFEAQNYKPRRPTCIETAHDKPIWLTCLRRQTIQDVWQHGDAMLQTKWLIE